MDSRHKDKIKKLMKPTRMEAFEDVVESLYYSTKNKIKNVSRWVNRNRWQATALTVGLIALPFVIPRAVNWYHGTVAESNIAEARALVTDLDQETTDTYREFLETGSIIIDSKEAEQKENLLEVQANIDQWQEVINQADIDFENGKYKSIRETFETNDENIGLIDQIEDEFDIVREIEGYITLIKQLRSTVLDNQERLSVQNAPLSLGYNEAGLNTVMGQRYQTHIPQLEKIILIAKRPDIVNKANSIYSDAKTHFIDSHAMFNDPQFIQYDESRHDNTFDTHDYANLIQNQDLIFAKIAQGDETLASLDRYLSELENQWYTIVTNRWEDSYQEPYQVRENNPAYSEWIEPEKYDVCQPQPQQCREIANFDGTVGKQCRDVPDVCTEHTRYVTKNNGQPKRIDVTYYRTIEQFFVTIEKHEWNDGEQISSDTDNLGDGNRNIWNSSEYQIGFQQWKPYGDDKLYTGIGGIGPNGEAPYLEVPK